MKSTTKKTEKYPTFTAGRAARKAAAAAKAKPVEPKAPEALTGLQQEFMMQLGRLAPAGSLVRVEDLVERMATSRPGCAIVETLRALEERGSIERSGNVLRIPIEGAEPLAELLATKRLTRAAEALVQDLHDLPGELAADLAAELHFMAVCWEEAAAGDVALMHDEIGRMLHSLDRKADLLAHVVPRT